MSWVRPRSIRKRSEFPSPRRYSAHFPEGRRAVAISSVAAASSFEFAPQKHCGRDGLKDTRELRKGDFWAAILILGISMAMIAVSTTFPMTDSYGGVQNVWYVSPALFPLIVGGALALLSLVLLAKAVSSGGARDAIDAIGTLSPRLAERDIRLLLIVTLIGAYVYALVPRVDFFIATALFLQAFVVTFYVDRTELSKPALLVFFAYAVILVIATMAGASFTRASDASIVADGIGIVAFVVLAVIGFLRVDDDELRRRFRISQWVGVIVPLILCPVFKYFLLVPLPFEGVVVRAMDVVRYGLRNLLA